MAEMLERAEDMNDFFFQYILTLALSAEMNLAAPPRYGIFTLMRALKLALEMPLKSKEIEDREVYKRLRETMEKMRDVPSSFREEWNECVKKTVAIMKEEL